MISRRPRQGWARPLSRLGALAGLLILAAIVLAGCDPFGPANGAGGVQLSITYNSSGGAEVQIFLDDRHRTRAELRSVGRQVGSLVFPTASRRMVRIDSNEGGYPFPVMTAQGVYRPGPKPHIDIDFRRATAWLFSQGATRVDVDLEIPRVPASTAWSRTPTFDQMDGNWSWDGITRVSDAPSGTVAMRPRTGRSIGVLVVLLGVVGALGAALVTAIVGRRRDAVVLAVAGLGLEVLGLALGSATAADSLGVAGALPHALLRGAALIPLVTVLGVVAGLSILVIMVATRPRRPREGNASDGG